ncbi:hypothetical protein [Haladaptatus litoreus]|uniref:hypothetical protein n=1 Tax=Haladaptatus litoreus TaxID=553468 RepID=UPI00158CDCA3|nr:hypothetical protein [Haladaptatus litoreus]
MRTRWRTLSADEPSHVARAGEAKSREVFVSDGGANKSRKERVSFRASEWLIRGKL